MRSFLKIVIALSTAALAVLGALAIIDLITRDDGKNILLKNLKPRSRKESDIELVFERGGQRAKEALEELSDAVEDTAEELCEELSEAVEQIDISEDDLDDLIS